MAAKDEKIYGLIGCPLTHSFSQRYFNQKFEAEGINARYLNFEIPDIGDFMEVLAEYPQLAGLNVTIPYKKQVMMYLDEVDPLAGRVGAVNVVRIERGKSNSDLRLTGYNTDTTAFKNTLKPLLKPWQQRALILGTGGAMRAVAVALEDLGIGYTLVSRTPGENCITYADLTEEVMADHKLIVNTTPLGMYPHTDECPDIPYDLLNSEYLCYDLLYNPETTLFMERAAAHGAEVKNGLEMLLLQAFESWEIWSR